MKERGGATLPASKSLNLGTYQFGKWQIETIADGRELAGVGLVKQVHGGNIVEISKLADKEAEADGIVVGEEDSRRAGIVTADCVPVVVIARARAAVLHVSRKSIVRGLMENLLTYFPASEIDRIYLGPHICEFHFKFEEERELLKQFRYKYPQAVHFHKGYIYLSIRKALLAQFDEWDIHRDKIEEDGRCTYEQLDLPSYRRSLNQEAGDGGRLYTIIGRY